MYVKLSRAKKIAGEFKRIDRYVTRGMHIFASPHFCVIRYLGDRIMDMNAYLSAHGLDQTAQYGKEILLALNSEEKQIAEVIASQQAQEAKFNLLFEHLEKLDVTMTAGVSGALSQDAAALVGQFASELKIARSEHCSQI